jgi:hypothetical protein
MKSNLLTLNTVNTALLTLSCLVMGLFQFKKAILLHLGHVWLALHTSAKIVQNHVTAANDWSAMFVL